MSDYAYEYVYESVKAFVIGALTGVEEIEEQQELTDYARGMKVAIKMILNHIEVTEDAFK